MAYSACKISLVVVLLTLGTLYSQCVGRWCAYGVRRCDKDASPGDSCSNTGDPAQPVGTCLLVLHRGKTPRLICVPGIGNPCRPNPCENGGTCNVNINGDWNCICAEGYTGEICDTAQPNPCRPNPCRNGGTCQSTGQDWNCVCPDGYTGDTCETATPP